MKNHIQKGDNITVAAPAAVSSGDPVLIGSLFGIAAGDADMGADVDLVTVGVFELPKLSTAAFDVGEAVYWDAADGELNEDNGNPKVGVAVKAATNPSATVAVRLDGVVS